MDDFSKELNKMISYFNEGNLEGAESIARKVLEINPGDINAIHIAARIFFVKKQYESALSLLSPHIDKYNGIQDIMNFYGEVLFACGSTDKAENIFDNILKTDANNCQAHYNMGKIKGASRLGLRHVDINTILSGKLKENEKEELIFSASNEQLIVDDIVNKISHANININQFCIDIGAHDGIFLSNSYFLYRKGWGGVCIESSYDRYLKLINNLKPFGDSVISAKCYALPGNVVSLLNAFGSPKEPGFLTLDIDSYEYDVLRSMLKDVKPLIICVEINERINPEIDFSLMYNSDKDINTLPVFFGGCSINLMNKLLEKNEYSIIALDYTNVIAVQDRLLPFLHGYRKLSPVEAWENGFYRRSDWRNKLPWNRSFLSWFEGDPVKCREEIKKSLGKFSDMFILE